MAKEKYNVRDERYLDGTHLYRYLKKHLKKKDFKVGLKKNDKDVSEAEMANNGPNAELSTKSKYTITITGNPAKIAGALPEGWSYDPNTNRIKNGNKAVPEYFDVAPIKSSKPTKDIVDMSDVMYWIRTKRPDLNVTAMDSNSMSISTDINNIDWKGIFGSKVRFNKDTCCLEGETSMGGKFVFHVVTENFKTDEKKDVPLEASYTSDANGVMNRGFSQGGRTTTDKSADMLYSAMSTMNPADIVSQAEMTHMTPSDARHLWETYTLVPNPQGTGLAVQEKRSGVVSLDDKILSQLTIVYNLVRMLDTSSHLDNNPYINQTTRGDIDWNKFDEIYERFASNPEALQTAMETTLQANEQGDNPNEMRADVREEVREGVEDGDIKVTTPSTPNALSEDLFKADGDLIHLGNADMDPDLPLSYKQMYFLDLQYERVKDANGITIGLREQSGSGSLVTDKVLIEWMIVKDALDTGKFASEEEKSNYWNSFVVNGTWRAEKEKLMRHMIREDQMEDQMVLTPSGNNNSGNNNY